MGAVHVGLAHVEVDDLVVSFPLVGGTPQQRILSRNHPDVVGEIRGAPFGRDHPTLQIYTEAHPVLPRSGCFSTHTQDPKILFLS